MLCCSIHSPRQQFLKLNNGLNGINFYQIYSLCFSMESWLEVVVAAVVAMKKEGDSRDLSDLVLVIIADIAITPHSSAGFARHFLGCFEVCGQLQDT